MIFLYIILFFRLGYYAARPNWFTDMTLADFATNYKKYHQKNKNKNPRRWWRKTDNSVSEGIRCNGWKNHPSYHTIPSMAWKKQPKQFYHSQLLLYFPSKDEEKDLHTGSYKGVCYANEEFIERYKKIYEYHSSKIKWAMEEVGIPEESWNILALQQQQCEYKGRTEGKTYNQSATCLITAICQRIMI